MTLEQFTKLYTENPNADEVMTEINRLYESERQLTESFATADSERNKLQKDFPHFLIGETLFLTFSSSLPTA